ncbi:hypothetical protein GTZ99_12865 [Novosphingobium sp. FSY-8]|uniref:DUF4139 domain-containing protein n=2 Tax=Novosphingobium ovatum TaxID=1908523 RepID=A0ABW9XFW0_9SPHN|nr:hypothetical protein [Novosphingobium ovatum]
MGAAGPVVTSAAPDSVAVSVYRDTDRGADAAMELSFLGGYALITETRVVDIPAGRSVLRFEGVAAGMLPESALVAGLPAGVREKNLDAALLSPHSLYGGAFGRPVTLRRIDPKTGATREEPAIIRSAPDGAAIVQTRAGFEIADCGPQKDQLVYDGLPQGLNARPTLSVAVDAPRAARARVSLSYLAWGFDWQAHYVLKLAPGARSAEMTAWVTLASSDSTSFPAAQTVVIGGRPNMETQRGAQVETPDLVMRCGIYPVRGGRPELVPVPPPPPVPVMAMPAPMMADIMVTATARKRVEPVTVRQEALGDLKLYRVPMPTTVAAHAQKQVALIAARPVKLQLLYKADVFGDTQLHPRVAVRLHNRKADGLGMALPAGKVSVWQPVRGATFPAGEGSMADKAQGEEIDVEVADGQKVTLQVRAAEPAPGRRDVRAELTNANPWPIRFEGRVPLFAGERIVTSSARLGRKNGLPLWVVTVPAHGRVQLRFAARAPS